MLMNTILILLALSALLIFIGLIVLCNKFVLPHCCGCMKSLCIYIGNKLMFNSVIRSLLEAYFPLSIATFYQLSLNQWNDENSMSNFLAVVSVIYLVTFPIFALTFVFKY